MSVCERASAKSITLTIVRHCAATAGRRAVVKAAGARPAALINKYVSAASLAKGLFGEIAGTGETSAGRRQPPALSPANVVSDTNSRAGASGNNHEHHFHCLEQFARLPSEFVEIYQCKTKCSREERACGVGRQIPGN